MLAIIGGSGLTQLASLDVSHREIVRTPYGEPSGPVTIGRLRDRPALFLARHGYGHTIPPHAVNYRANIWALKHKGATGILSIASVGGIRADLKPGEIVIPDQIIDYTWGRHCTYFEGDGCPVTHVDFTEPYDAGLRDLIIRAAAAAGIAVKPGGVYAASQGPRLETAAEVNRFERDGCHLVGMTGMPEAGLAREIELPYAAINVIANYAAGRGDSAHSIHFEAINDVLEVAMHDVRRIVEELIVYHAPHPVENG